MQPPAKCPIWSEPAEVQVDSAGAASVSSMRAAGDYRITLEARKHLSSASPAVRARLTTWLIEQRLGGEDAPLIRASDIHSAEHRPALSVAERRDNTLSFFATRSPTVGAVIRFSGSADDEFRTNHSGVQAWSESHFQQEALTFVEYLCKSRLAEPAGEGYRITFEGWTYLEEHRAKRAASMQAFVAMWFHSSMEEAYSQGLEPGIRDAGFLPVRIDKKEHNNKIDDEIVAEIRRSRFLVADFTAEAGRPRGGVYFEAGFALGLRKPVIWVCREDLISEVHFDTRQFNHITWKKPTDLRTKLANRISAVIGDGPQRVEQPRAKRANRDL